MQTRFRRIGIVQCLIMPMGDDEEALDDFITENPVATAEVIVGTHRAESTNDWTAASGITSKIPPLHGGSTSWFEYEELIEDWQNLTVLEASKRGPTLKNRRSGVAEK